MIMKSDAMLVEGEHTMMNGESPFSSKHSAKNAYDNHDHEALMHAEVQRGVIKPIVHHGPSNS